MCRILMIRDVYNKESAVCNKKQQLFFVLIYSMRKKNIKGDHTMKKKLKKQVNQTVRSVFIYSLILTGVALLYAFWKGADIIRKGELFVPTNQIMKEIFRNAIDKAGILSLVGTAVGLLYMAVRYRKTQAIREMMRERKRMTLRMFLMIFSVFMSCQVLFMAAAVLIEQILNPLGYTLSGAAKSASAVSDTLPMFFYGGLAAPVAEEFVFRGYVMKKLLPFGKEFAIVISAILFGLIHGNFLQGFFAVGAGLVLGYAAVEYSMKWAVLIHILNNLVFFDLMGRMTKIMAEPLKAVFEYGVPFTFFAAACIILFLNREKIAGWRNANRIEKRYCIYTFTSLWTILFMVMQIMAAMNGLEKI